MKVIVTCRMGPGTFEAKLEPLIQTGRVEKVYVLRKSRFRDIQGVEYIVLPSVCRYKAINIVITPVLLAYYAKKLNCALILSYHIVPHAFFAFAASLFTGIPFIVAQTGLMIQKHVTESCLLNKTMSFVMRRAFQLNVPGDMSRDFWISQGVERKKIVRLHSSIDTNHFKPWNKHKEYDFIFLGRLAPEKRVDKIVEAFSLLNENYSHHMRLVIVGDGPCESHIAKLIKEKRLESKVVMAGFQSDAVRFLNLSSVMVMFSSTEGLPTALTQAMSCGLICISTNVGNIEEAIVHNRTGFFIDDDIESLAELMHYSIIKYDALGDVRQFAREIVLEKHSHEIATQKWHDTLDKLEQNS